MEKLKRYDLNCNIFDVYNYDGLSMQELLCQFYTKINECVEFSNSTLDLCEWLVSEGLNQEVSIKLTNWLNDGTLENIINVSLFENLNNKIDNVTSKLEQIENMSDIEKAVEKIKESTYLKPINVKLIGDSITHGMGGSFYSQSGETIYGDFKVNTNGYCWANNFKKYLETNYHCNVKNYGTSGVKARDILENLSALVSSEDDVIVLMIGTNNKLDRELHTFKSELKQIIERIENMGKDCIVMCSIPTTVINDSNTPYTMREIDNAINEVVNELGKTYISLYKHWIEYCASNGLIESSLFADNVHPNNTGYLLITHMVLKSLGLYTKADFSYYGYWKTDRLLKTSDLQTLSCAPYIDTNNQLYSYSPTKPFPVMFVPEDINTVEFDVTYNEGTWVVLGGDFEKTLICAITKSQGGLIFTLDNEYGGEQLQGYNYNNTISKVKIERLEDRFRITYNNSDIKEYLFNSGIFNNISNKRLWFMVQSSDSSGLSYKNIVIKN